MRASIEVGARIADMRKSLRFEKRFYCPRDGRMVAAVVPFEGVRYLWVVGGRDEHAQALLADLFGELTAWRDNEELHRAQGEDPGEYDRLHKRLLDAYREVSEKGQSETSPTAYDLSDEYYVGQQALRDHGYDFPPLPHHAPCPRCHRSSVLLVSPAGVTQQA